MDIHTHDTIELTEQPSGITRFAGNPSTASGPGLSSQRRITRFADDVKNENEYKPKKRYHKADRLEVRDVDDIDPEEQLRMRATRVRRKHRKKILTHKQQKQRLENAQLLCKLSEKICCAQCTWSATPKELLKQLSNRKINKKWDLANLNTTAMYCNFTIFSFVIFLCTLLFTCLCISKIASSFPLNVAVPIPPKGSASLHIEPVVNISHTLPTHPTLTFTNYPEKNKESALPNKSISINKTPIQNIEALSNIRTMLLEFFTGRQLQKKSYNNRFRRSKNEHLRFLEDSKSQTDENSDSTWMSVFAPLEKKLEETLKEAKKALSHQAKNRIDQSVRSGQEYIKGKIQEGIASAKKKLSKQLNERINYIKTVINSDSISPCCIFSIKCFLAITVLFFATYKCCDLYLEHLAFASVLEVQDELRRTVRAVVEKDFLLYIAVLKRLFVLMDTLTFSILRDIYTLLKYNLDVVAKSNFDFHADPKNFRPESSANDARKRHTSAFDEGLSLVHIMLLQYWEWFKYYITEGCKKLVLLARGGGYTEAETVSQNFLKFTQLQSQLQNQAKLIRKTMTRKFKRDGLFRVRKPKKDHSIKRINITPEDFQHDNDDLDVVTRLGPEFFVQHVIVRDYIKARTKRQRDGVMRRLVLLPWAILMTLIFAAMLCMLIAATANKPHLAVISIGQDTTTHYYAVLPHWLIFITTTCAALYLMFLSLVSVRIFFLHNVVKAVSEAATECGNAMVCSVWAVSVELAFLEYVASPLNSLTPDEVLTISPRIIYDAETMFRSQSEFDGYTHDELTHAQQYTTLVCSEFDNAATKRYDCFAVHSSLNNHLLEYRWKVSPLETEKKLLVPCELQPLILQQEEFIEDRLQPRRKFRTSLLRDTPDSTESATTMSTTTIYYVMAGDDLSCQHTSDDEDERGESSEEEEEEEEEEEQEKKAMLPTSCCSSCQKCVKKEEEEEEELEVENNTNNVIQKSIENETDAVEENGPFIPTKDNAEEGVNESKPLTPPQNFWCPGCSQRSKYKNVEIASADEIGIQDMETQDNNLDVDKNKTVPTEANVEDANEDAKREGLVLDNVVANEDAPCNYKSSSSFPSGPSNRASTLLGSLLHYSSDASLLHEHIMSEADGVRHRPVTWSKALRPELTSKKKQRSLSQPSQIKYKLKSETQ